MVRCGLSPVPSPQPPAPSPLARFTGARRVVVVLLTLLVVAGAACATPLRYPDVTPTATAPPATATVVLTTVPTLAPTASPSPLPAITPTIAATVAPSATAVPASPTLAATPSPTAVPTGPAVVVRRVQTTDKVVALTYDAGADRGQTPLLLSTLEHDGIKVTFGMTGLWAQSNPDMMRRIVADGDELMNHTYNHESFTGFSARPAVLTAEARAAELERTEQVVQELTGATTKPLFRPPYGDYNPSVLTDVGTLGYHYSIMWTVDSGGWEGLPVPQILARCLQGAEPGAIYVLHVGAASQDIAATQQIIDGLQAEGYRFETVGQLLGI